MHDSTSRPMETALPCLTAAELRALVCGTVAAFDADTVAPQDAVGLMHEWAAIEHAAAVGKAMAAARAATGSAVRDAGARDAGEWMARRTGTTAAKARDELAAAGRLRDLPATDGAARRGELSPAQTAAIADAASVDPSAERRLLDAAKRESVGELRDRCARTKAAADADPEATRRRIHAARGLRRYSSPDGLHHLHAAGPAEALAAVDAALRPYVEARFTAARRAGERDTHEAYSFDALVALADATTRPTATGPTATGATATGATATGPTTTDAGAPGVRPPDALASGANAQGATTAGATAATPGGDGTAPAGAIAARGNAVPGAEGKPLNRATPARHKIIMRADLDALVRGTVAGGETCEIAGVGPVSVQAVRELLGESVLHLVITKGKGVANVTYLGRGPSAAQRIALLWQAPACSREGCNRKARLEVDHRTPWVQCRVTRLEDLDPLCRHDHQLKTHHGWALVAGTGPRAMVPPDHLDHPGRRSPPAPGDDP